MMFSLSTSTWSPKLGAAEAIADRVATVTVATNESYEQSGQKLPDSGGVRGGRHQHDVAQPDGTQAELSCLASEYLNGQDGLTNTTTTHRNYLPTPRICIFHHE